MQSSIDYQDQSKPFEKLRELTAHLTDIFPPERDPIDWLDEKEAELEAGRVWMLEQKGKMTWTNKSSL